MICVSKKVFAALAICQLFAVNEYAMAYGIAEVKDVRVAPLVSSKWSVGDFGGANAFNFYTPKNYSCGCGITAYAQIMRFWRAPNAVAAKKFQCWLDGVPGSYSTRGGAYAWDEMPFTGEECVNDAQREALGHLAFDLGVASHVSWANIKYSYSYGVLSVAALQDYFGYASARTLMRGASNGNIFKDEDYRNALLASLDAGMPAVIGVRTVDNQGHQVVVDGYGFDDAGKLLCHLNFGWNGAADNWYNLMENAFAAGDGIDEFVFAHIDEIAYNIHPSKKGEVISGRVLDKAGNPVKNISVRFGLAGKASSVEETLTDENGIYSFRFTGKGKYVVSVADENLGQAERTITISKDGASVALVPSLDFSVPFTSFKLYANAIGTVGNRWGEDLVLKEGSSAPIPPPTTGPIFSAAATIDGYLTDAGGKMAGTIQVKAGKADKAGQSKMTANVMINGQAKKWSFKGVMAADGSASLSCAGQPALNLAFDEKGMSGKLGGRDVVGVRNLFASKVKTEVNEANAALKTLLGTLNVASDGTFLTVTIAAKGKVKVTGMIGEKKVSTTSQLLLGETQHVIPVLVTKPTMLAFLVNMAPNGSVISVEGLKTCKAGKVVGLRSNAKFHVDTSAELWKSLQGNVITGVLPDGQPVPVSGSKWILDKAGKVVYKKGTTDLDDTKFGKNPSALKLTYKAKDGTFKGAFKVYCEVKGRLKATTVNVTGVLIGDRGYGSASIKKVGSVPITVE